MRILAIWALAIAAPAWANIGGPDLGLSGAPGDSNCTACHIGAPLNEGGGELKVELLEATTYTAGEQYRLRVTLSDPQARRWGFLLTARRAEAPTERAGTLATEDAAIIQVRDDPVRNVQYASHTLEGTQSGTEDEASWEFLWTAPGPGAGAVTFYAAGNAANNDLTTAGDNIYTASLEVGVSGEDPPLTAYALPQFVYGSSDEGSWHTALYFHNSNTEEATMRLHFRGDDGADLPFPDGPEQMLTLAAGETRIVTPPEGGELVSGWVEAGLPSGVSGYGVFRQSVPDRDDNEAVVLLTPASHSAWTLIHDDMGLTTALSLLNPGEEAVAVDYIAYAEAGDEAGSGSIELGPRSKTALALRDLPGLSGVEGSRGAVEFRVASGSLAVLGLRFAASAFTSIPALER